MVSDVHRAMYNTICGLYFGIFTSGYSLQDVHFRILTSGYSALNGESQRVNQGLIQHEMMALTGKLLAQSCEAGRDDA